MAFSYTVSQEPISVGSRRWAWGTYTSADGSTGGDIVTPLHTVENVQLTSSGSSVAADDPTVNETLPLASGTITIVTTANSTGYWLAIGY